MLSLLEEDEGLHEIGSDLLVLDLDDHLLVLVDLLVEQSDLVVNLLQSLQIELLVVEVVLLR